MRFGLSNNFGVTWHCVEQNGETDEEHDDGCVEERFQLARVKSDRDGGKDREDLGMGYCSINV